MSFDDEIIIKNETFADAFARVATRLTKIDGGIIHCLVAVVTLFSFVAFFAYCLPSVITVMDWRMIKIFSRKNQYRKFQRQSKTVAALPLVVQWNETRTVTKAESITDEYFC